MQEKLLGPEHPSVTRTLNNLAGFMEDLGREDEAKELKARLER